MDKSEPAAATVISTASEFPQRKPARQLDFTALFRASATMILPEHPQARLQSKLMALAKPVVLQPQIVKQQPKPQTQPGPKQIVPLVPPVAHRVAALPQPQPRLQVVVKKAPNPRRRGSIEVKDGTPKKQKLCNCRNSRCLKLYCECFASGMYCDGCNCINCHNNVEHDAARQEAIGATLERNPNAFKPKIANSPHRSQNGEEEAVEIAILAKHNKGCNCKKSGCLKKYCECFQANVLCSENCKCIDCKNFEGSEERRALFHGDSVNFTSYTQHATNAAVNGAIGSSQLSTPPPSKRNSQQLMFSPTASDRSIYSVVQFLQENHARASPACSPLASPTSCTTSVTAQGSSKLTYRSTLADVVQPQDVKELCSLLVVASAEAAKTVSDKRSKEGKQSERDWVEGSTVSFAHEKHDETKKIKMAIPDDHLSGNQTKRLDDTGSDESDGQNRGPPSPATLRLMCDEHDTMFMASRSPDAAASSSENKSLKSLDRYALTELYVEQERIVLTKFWNFLNQLITCGSIKESIRSPLAKTRYGIQAKPAGNGIIGTRTETSSFKELANPGTVKSIDVVAEVSQRGTVVTSGSRLTSNGEMEAANGSAYHPNCV